MNSQEEQELKEALAHFGRRMAEILEKKDAQISDLKMQNLDLQNRLLKLDERREESA